MNISNYQSRYINVSNIKVDRENFFLLFYHYTMTCEFYHEEIIAVLFMNIVVLSPIAWFMVYIFSLNI